MLTWFRNVYRAVATVAHGMYVTLITMLKTIAVRRPLWSGPPIPSDREAIPMVDGVVHRTIHTATEEGYKFLHGAAIVQHNGTLFANWVQPKYSDQEGAA